ncbi:MAG: helix-turn-helix transcriptional regulator [Clostridiales bacterium]|nr:helix-turn-helix transcriptional regulator [Clostridiales bacterium]
MKSQTIIDTLNQIIRDQDISTAAVARRIGKSSQALNIQLNNDDMKISTLLEIVEALKCDINIAIIDRADKKEYKIKGD